MKIQLIVDGIVMYDFDSGDAPAWNPANVPPGYDLPAQTMADILDEYEAEWRTERFDPLQPCGINGCPMCDLDYPGE